jgi:hypothetical protein
MITVATYESLKNLLENLIFLPMRLRVCARSHSKYRTRTQALTTTRHTLEQSTKYGIENHRIVFNVALYLLLLDQDLADFTDYMVNATGDRKRAFIAKHEAMLLYEASEDITQLIGREFRDAIKALGTSEDQLRRLNAVSSNLNEFWQTNREFLGTIRKVLAAHRDQNSLHYLESLEQLKPLDVMNCAAGLSGRIEQLVSLITNVALASSNLGSILRDMLESGKKHGQKL